MAHGRMKEKEARAKFRQVGVTPSLGYGPNLCSGGLAYRESLPAFQQPRNVAGWKLVTGSQLPQPVRPPPG